MMGDLGGSFSGALFLGSAHLLIFPDGGFCFRSPPKHLDKILPPPSLIEQVSAQLSFGCLYYECNFLSKFSLRTPPSLLPLTSLGSSGLHLFFLRLWQCLKAIHEDIVFGDGV